jgi:hypothetical protein
MPALRQDLQGQRDDTLPTLRREDQMRLAWKVCLTPLAFIILPLYIFGYAWMGLFDWFISLIKFWGGDYDD